MYRLLIQISCSLLLVAAISWEPEETFTTVDSFEFPAGFPMPELGEPSAQERDLMMAHKINWLATDEPQSRQARAVEQEEPVTPTPVEEIKAGNECPIDNERGLTALIRNARPLLPADRLRNILANAREDPEVRALVKLLRSEQFQERVVRLNQIKEKIDQKDFLCRTLKLNYGYYMEYVRMLFNAQLSETPSSPLPNRRKGIRGLLLDLRDALPRAVLRDLYRRQLASDKELVTAVRHIRSREFRRLLINLRALPEYRALRDDLLKVGVPLQQLLSLMSNALGWSNLDLGTELDLVTL
ncbi:PREDICTED: uncharacterized protein LOC108609981 isoform X2 [Drosophila arizonae]|uniref:Uncharacterized protein LOC108609981 isoform X1 n=1 Tax=Drosophila arizonae TaxID=7263 RepID=A0ABM1NQN8_DROAR|nr:PREDICTED: uncharacterized protein LOC108609981 isoform X1 [Drosophila arizonae]XP_017857275.1 PREDICTED: uncharacterized protein LOC108609981 isoform X2 [Drosophila arizonae]